jgi:phosphopantetheine--protein transferase-like protein
MPVSCGVDILYIPGLQKILRDEAMLGKFIDPKELTKSTPEHIAGIIAAKEAFFKALGVFPKFREIHIACETTGKPKLIVPPKLKKFKSCDVSISHDKDYAIAMVVLET